jgi:hypothetical protein
MHFLCSILFLSIYTVSFQVSLTCNDTSEVYEFVYNNIIILNEENDSWTEIPAENKENQLQSQNSTSSIYKIAIFYVFVAKTYELLVYTGMDENAGTKANIYTEIVGTRGDTGRRKLLKSSESGAMFIQSKVDVFTIKAVDLDVIEKVIVGHDAQGKGEGWLLDKVVVREDGKEFLSPCER